MEKRQNWILAVSVALFTVCLGFLKLQELPSWHISFGETSREDKLTTTFGQRLHQQQTEVNHIIENIRAQVGLHKWEDAEAVESVKDQPRHEAKGYKLEALRPLPGSMIRRDSPLEISVTVKRPPNSKSSELREVKAVLKYGETDNTVWEYDVPPLPSDNAETIILHKVDESKDAMTFSATVNPGKTAGGFTTISYIAILDNQTCLEAVSTVYADDCDWSARKVGPLRDVLNAKLARQRKETSDWQLSRQKTGSRYTPLHPELRQFSSEYLVKDFWRQNITEVKGMPGVFFVPQVFSPKFLTLLNEELTHANSQNVNWTRQVVHARIRQDLCLKPASRPNTMNNFGFMLAELGFEDFFNDFVTKVLNPLRLRFLPEWGHLDSQHTFTIGYG